MIKCLFAEKLVNDDIYTKRCDAEADYIFMGKSYCAEHFYIRAQEMVELRKKQDEPIPAE